MLCMTHYDASLNYHAVESYYVRIPVRQAVRAHQVLRLIDPFNFYVSQLNIVYMLESLVFFLSV